MEAAVRNLKPFAPLAIAILIAAFVAWMTFGSLAGGGELWRDTQRHLAVLHYGRVPPSPWIATNFRLIGNAALMWGALLAAALILLPLSARWRKTSLADIQKLEWARKAGAILLLVMALVMLPNATLLLLETIVAVHDGGIWSTSLASYASGWMSFLFMFLLYSRLLYGRAYAESNDELTQHFRARAYQTGFWVLLGGCVLLFVAWMASPLWADLLLPVLLSLGLAVPMLHFAWLELRPERGG